MLVVKTPFLFFLYILVNNNKTNNIYIMSKKLLSIGFLCCVLHTGWAQKIMNWYGGKSSAVSVTFDDWSPGHGGIAVPNLIEKGLVGTFYVTTKNTWEGYAQIKNAFNNGCEIGNHTKTHPVLTEYLDNETFLQDEIGGAKTLLEKNVSGLNITSFCYPQGAGTNSKTITDLVKEGHICARGIFPRNTWNYRINDYYEIPTIAVNKNLSLDEFKSHLTTVQKDGGLMTFMYHSISNSSIKDNWFDEITEETFVSQLDELKKVEDNIWITTLDKAIRYHKEKNAATLFEVQNIESQRVFSLTDTLSNNSLYSHPLTIQIPLNGESYQSVEQDGVALTFRQEGDMLYFDAVPDVGNIILKKNVAASIFGEIINENIEIGVYPNIVNESAIIQVEVNEPTTVQVDLYSEQGQFVKTLITTYQDTKKSEYTIPFNFLSKGRYILNLQTDYGEKRERLLKL